MDDLNNQFSLKSKIEAILFSYGEAISTESLALVLFGENSEKEESLKVLNEAINDLKVSYETDLNKAIKILQFKNKIQLVTKPEFSFIIEKLLKNEVQEELSESSLEVLSIIAYGSPVEKSVIDHIRGVNSILTLKNLELRGLVEKNIDDKKARYSITQEFLKNLGLTDMKDIPEYEKFKNLVESAKTNLNIQDA